jgi:hypothetical protein
MDNSLIAFTLVVAGLGWGLARVVLHAREVFRG